MDASVNASGQPQNEADDLRQQLEQALRTLQHEQSERRRLEAERLDWLQREQVALAAARSTRREIASVLERVTDAFLALDTKWRCTYLNRKAAQMFGKEPEDYIGRDIWAQFPEAVGGPFYQAYHKAIAEQVTLEIEEYYPPWDKWIEVRVYPSLNGLSIFFKDVTERHQVQAELASSAAKLHEAEQIAHLGVWEWNVRQNQVTWTPGLLEIYGLKPHEFDGTFEGYLARVVPEDRERVRNTVWQAYQQRAPLQMTERILRPDGQQRVLRSIGKIFFDDAGEPVRMMGVCLDVTTLEQTRRELEESVTELKRAQDALRHLNVTLEGRVSQRTQRLAEVNAELESFVYSVSHDLRSPLLTMHGFAQALLEDYGVKLDEQGRDYAKRIVVAARTMDSLIHELLAYSRLSRTEIALEPVELDRLLDDILANLEAELRQRGAQVVVQRPLGRVLGHEPTLLQVVSNLLTNAIKFVAPGVQPRVRVHAESRGSAIRLWVEDNGIGIAPEYQERIFRVFERLHGVSAYPGTGIGLAVVRKGVDRMSGQCGVQSEPGQGSRFWIELASAGGQS